MKNLLALAVGLAAASYAIRWWVKREVKNVGLLSGGTQILNPPGGP